MSRLNLEGKKFGKLIVQSFLGSDKFRRALWNCKCECGGIKIVASRELISKAVISCGCLRNATRFKIKHGKARTSEYHIWTNMKLRCSEKCPKNMKRYYLDRGIKVHDSWNKPNGFDEFISYVGWKPSDDHSLDRIDNNRGYEPGNVRWATRTEQRKNQRKKMAIESFSDEEIMKEYKRRGL
jgi:hypothetical protein